jgi:hypothetical protein
MELFVENNDENMWVTVVIRAFLLSNSMGGGV